MPAMNDDAVCLPNCGALIAGKPRSHRNPQSKAELRDVKPSANRTRRRTHSAASGSLPVGHDAVAPGTFGGVKRLIG